MGLSNRQSWFGFWLGQSRFSHTDQGKQGSTGWIYTEGQTIPTKHATLSGDFMKECDNFMTLSEFSQVSAGCHAAAWPVFQY